MGLSFAGIMPHIHNGEDRMLMQYINIPIEPDTIKVYGDMTKRLADYIMKASRNSVGWEGGSDLHI